MEKSGNAESAQAVAIKALDDMILAKKTFNETLSAIKQIRDRKHRQASNQNRKTQRTIGETKAKLVSSGVGGSCAKWFAQCIFEAQTRDKVMSP